MPTTKRDRILKMIQNTEQREHLARATNGATIPEWDRFIERFFLYEDCKAKDTTSPRPADQFCYLNRHVVI
jgi:hypothetical protein